MWVSLSQPTMPVVRASVPWISSNVQRMSTSGEGMRMTIALSMGSFHRS